MAYWTNKAYIEHILQHINFKTHYNAKISRQNILFSAYNLTKKPIDI